MTFWNGDKQEEDLPPVSIQLTEGDPTDCLGNPMSWFIVSRNCANMLTPLTESHVQMISLPVTLPNQKVAKDRYVIANPVGSIDAIYSPKKHKEKIRLVDLVIDTRLVPEGIHMFRLKFHETTIVVTSLVIQTIQDSDLRGFAANPLNLFPNPDSSG
jgi:hypothetical protein